MSDLTTTEAPSVDPSRIEKFYQDLSAMQLDLDADPLALGPKRINQKTAECRGFLSKTERMFLEVSQDLYWYKREHRRALADFELAVQDLMTNDPEVRAGRNITDREAVAHTKLRSDRERISVLQFASEDLEAVLSVIRTKRNDLKDIASRLRDQLKICQEEITLGGRWGSSRRISGGGEDISQPDGVEALLDSVLATTPTKPEMDEIDLEEVTPPSEVESLKGEDSPSMDSLLEEIGSTPPAKSFPVAEADSGFDDALNEFEGHIPKTIVVEAKIDPVLDDILDSF